MIIYMFTHMFFYDTVHDIQRTKDVDPALGRK